MFNLKRKLILIVSLMLLIIFPAAAFASPITTDFNTAIKYANTDISARYNYKDTFYISKNKNNLPLNANTWKKYNYSVFVYGNPHGEKRNGENRYLGYTLFGEDYTNINFAMDAFDPTKRMEDRNWIAYPWKSNKVSKAISALGENPIRYNEFDALPINQILVYRGLSREKDENGNPLPMGSGAKTEPWHLYVHVLQPPTEYTSGIGRMWHISNGTVWYKTVYLPQYSEIFTPVDPPKGEVPGFKGELGGGGGFR